MAIDGSKIRSTILQVITDRVARFGPEGSGLQANGVLSDVATKLTPSGTRLARSDDEALLIAFYDLFRSGHLRWGFNLANANPPFFHVTEHGRRALEHLSRDPANPDGYLAYLSSRAKLPPIASSYIAEALPTYNANCFRAAAVMIGVAAESLILLLRDVTVAGIEIRGRTPAKELTSPFIKRVGEALYKELEMQREGMSKDLHEQFQTTWPALAYQIRAARNDAGHPVGMSSITPETVHGALLIFPELASLWRKLLKFAATHYNVTKS